MPYLCECTDKDCNRVIPTIEFDELHDLRTDSADQDIIHTDCTTAKSDTVLVSTTHALLLTKERG